MNLKRPIIFFDLETTGVETSIDRIVQIATIKVFPNGDVEEKKYLINPLIPIPKQASDVHGITDEMVKDAPTFEKFSKNLNKYFEDSDIGGYNSNRFDIPLLIEEFARVGIDFDTENRNYIDVMNIETVVNSRKLSDVYKRYMGKDLEGAHDALSDVRATYEILKEQIKIHNLADDLESIDKLSQGDRERVDLSGKLCNIDGKICWTFGKNINQPILNDLNYLSWFLKQDVPAETRKIINKLRKNE